MWKRILGASVCASAMMVALAGPAAAGTTATGEGGSSVVIQTWYPKHVKSTVSSVRVFVYPRGDIIWGTWGPCTNFNVDRNDDGRYHTLIRYSNGVVYDAWVTADPAYVAPGHCG